MNPDDSDIPRQLDYYRNRLDELSGQVIKADSIVSRTKRELKQRRSAFALLSELQRAISTDMSSADVFARILPAIQHTLKMDRTLLLGSSGDRNLTVVANTGYDASASVILQQSKLPAPPELLKPGGQLLVTAAASPSPLIDSIRKLLQVPYFIAVPVHAGDDVPPLLLISGRAREAKPFYPPLDEGDVYTFQSLAGFLGSALHNSELFGRVKKMASSFSRFVPAQFLEFLNRRSIVDVELGDQTAAEMSILFSDIRSFTSLSEKMSPKETFDFINAYLRHAAPVVRDNNGFIDKYIGDAIMALFPKCPADGLRAAIGLHKAAGVFNATRGASPITIGVGLHTGPIMLGTIGFEGRMESTVIADAVNLASRLEGLTKMYGAGVIVSGQLISKIQTPCEFHHRLIDRVQVMGKNQGIDIIEVFHADPADQVDLKLQTRDVFDHAMTSYFTGDFLVASDGFAQVVARNPKDKAAQLQLGRCRHYLESGAPQNWTGIAALDHK